MALPAVSLDDKYALDQGRIFLTGTQALVRLLFMQRRRDAAAGLNTAGFVSGYRGSPLGGLDQSLWKAKPFLKQHHVHFWPGVNEDLAATAIWGSQQVNLFEGARYDGVYSMWYGKGPGVDRCGDVFKHGNAAGTSPHGGVLVVAGDDHAAKSSTLAHQSDHMFVAAMMPVLYPASVQEYLDLGIHGWAMSRYSGCWVGFKALSDTVESSGSVYADPQRVQVAIPGDFELPAGGVHIRGVSEVRAGFSDPPLEQERRLQGYKVYAALAYARANRLNSLMIDSPRPRLGIITSGKSYLDVRQALDDLGIDDRLAAEIGLRLYKVAMVWPLEPEGVRHFAEGLEEILVVEEKRQMIEYQLKEQLYNWRDDVRPRVVGKFDEKGEWALPHGDWLLPAAGELTAAQIAKVIAARIARFHTSDRIKARLAFLEAQEKALARSRPTLARVPYYCSGCPHNTSTRVPEGSRALAGIGCHAMALWIYPERTKTFSQMGGEGVAWIGQAPFTETSHVFANLGDGTYFHSGYMAIRAALAAKVNITYKILYNDAVAMTGGQPVDGVLTVPQITRQVAAEGVERIVVVTDQPEKYPADSGFAPGVAVRHRDELDAVQRELREYAGVSVLLYDQTCAAEKRRRRKRGEYPDPPLRAFINERVCEGCGDCSAKSNCLSVVSADTEFGRKRAIDQSSCNKDFSCVKGFCPSFVTVAGGKLRKGRAPAAAGDAPVLPAPGLPAVGGEPYNVLIIGIGGTGVITIGAILGMAAHLEGRGVSVLDMTGLSQKGGSVLSHVRIADRPESIHGVRIASGEAHAVIGCDIVGSVWPETLSKMRQGWTRGVINRAQTQTGAFVHNPDLAFPEAQMEREVAAIVGERAVAFLDATRLATALMGDSMATNMFMLGYAFQQGLIPVTEASILKAIELNGVAVEANRQSFVWGRRAAHDLAAVERLAGSPGETRPAPTTLDELIARRMEDLAAYQNRAYARRYRELVERVRAVEAERLPGRTELAEAVARYYHKLMAYKDEYEVARLYSDGDFIRRVGEVFEGDYRLTFHLAPPAWVKPDPATGEAHKRKYGPWMFAAFKLLAKFKGLRGTPLDVFGYSEERRMERRLITEYQNTVGTLLAGLTPENHALAIEIAALPEDIRGFGHVKQRHLAAAKKREVELLEKFRNPPPATRMAA